MVSQLWACFVALVSVLSSSLRSEGPFSPAGQAWALRRKAGSLWHLLGGAPLHSVCHLLFQPFPRGRCHSLSVHGITQADRHWVPARDQGRRTAEMELSLGPSGLSPARY